MDDRFDLTDLRVFLNIARAGSITAGANASHLSLAAASARVQGMEQALSTPLFTRGRRGVQPTAAGLALMHHAQVVLEQAERLRRDLEDQARSHKVHISILGTSAAIREYLPDALGDFLVRHPQVNLSAAEALGDDALRAVADGTADIALVTERHAIHPLESFHFVDNRFALVTPLDHPLVREAQGGPISVARADGCDIVGLLQGSALQDTWDARAQGRGARLNYRVRVPSFDAQVRLVERGVGVSLMPLATAERFARSMAIAVLPMSDTFLKHALLVCVRQFAALPADARELVETLRGPGRPG